MRIKYFLQLVLIIPFIFLKLFSFSNEIKVEGIYQGKNIYVLNPFVGSENEYCIIQVTVNSQEINGEINSSAFEIDLSIYQFNIGDKIIITIEHDGNCAPKILNPQVLNARSTFNIGSIKVDKSGFLVWKTNSELGKLNFIVEQYRWNKWIKVGEVEAWYKFLQSPG